METKKKIGLPLAALLVMSLALPAAATDYAASDYLPLAVGNSWTYSHEYYDLENMDDEGWGDQWPEFWGNHVFTITVERTEVIDDTTYYVISDMPANWPPAPPHFIAGKKLRWEGTHLMERTTDGEQALYRFDGANETGYEIPTTEGDTRVTVEILPESVPVYAFYFHGYGEGGRGIGFLAGYGLDIGGWRIFGTDHPLFINQVDALRAVLGGTAVEYEDALVSTSTSSSSWGGVKQSFLAHSAGGRNSR